MNLPFRLQWFLVRWRMDRLTRKSPITSFDMLQMSVDVTRLILKTDDRAMLVDWLKHSLLPALKELTDWANEEVEMAEEAGQ